MTRLEYNYVTPVSSTKYSTNQRSELGCPDNMRNTNLSRVCFRSLPGRGLQFQRAFSNSRHLTAKDEPVKPKDQKSTPDAEKAAKRKKTMEQMDEEIRAAMEGHAGDGGISGAELEGGKAVSMKRGTWGGKCLNPT